MLDAPQPGQHPRVSVVIPALNEAAAIGLVLAGIPRALVHEVIVVDNGSTDATARVAADGGARVLQEAERGYGAACLKGIAAADAPDVLVFLDADYSDHPDELPLVLGPIARGEADLVIGSRTRKRTGTGGALAASASATGSPAGCCAGSSARGD
ncbi:MAG: glycosyltransferase family 2 protein [Planctomycetota bacterium]